MTSIYISEKCKEHVKNSRGHNRRNICSIGKTRVSCLSKVPEHRKPKNPQWSTYQGASLPQPTTSAVNVRINMKSMRQ